MEQEPLSVFKRSQMDQDYPLDGPYRRLTRAPTARTGWVCHGTKIASEQKCFPSREAEFVLFMRETHRVGVAFLEGPELLLFTRISPRDNFNCFTPISCQSLLPFLTAKHCVSLCDLGPGNPAPAHGPPPHGPTAPPHAHLQGPDTPQSASSSRPH
jgi:hypothetical protein